MNYLVTGATGGLGGMALRYLKEMVPQEALFALVRSEEKGASLREEGFQLRIGDYGDEKAMVAAFTGIDRVLFVSSGTDNRQQEHTNVVKAAQIAGVAYIAYTSYAEATQSTAALAADHVYTEKLIEESGISHTFLRNNWYLENELFLISDALKTGKFVYAAGEGKTGWALRREYAEVAANALAGKIEADTLELSGNPITYQALGEALKEATGTAIDIVSTDDQEFVQHLIDGGLPQPVAEIFLTFQQDIKDNQLAVVSTDFEQALGRPLVSPVAGLKELLA